MLPHLKHFSVTFMHISDSGLMDGFQALDCYAFSEQNAIKRMSKKFKKLHHVKASLIEDSYFSTWLTDCEVI